jgi:hypothetical protein
MIRLEALNAKHGDALLLHYKTGAKQRLWIIDGGPAGTWNGVLRPRLEELKGDGDQLIVDLAMVSHVDEDHVTGMEQMTRGLARNAANAASFLEFRRFWHNSFADLVGSEASFKQGMASLAAAQGAATAAMASDSSNVQLGGATLSHRREIAVLASINQGRELRNHIELLQLSGNEPFGDTLSSKSGRKKIDEANVTVVGPIKSRLDVFRQKWEEATGKPAALAGLFREDLDESPTNLSSIVMLVEVGNRKILLTGDARGDDVLDGFKDANLGNKLPMKLDILKMPHHGSDRNMTEAFLKAFPADHYIISADGKHGNPDPNTVRAIVQVRGNAKYKMHFTNTVAKLPQLLKTLSTGKKFEFAFRGKNDLSIAVELD